MESSSAHAPRKSASMYGYAIDDSHSKCSKLNLIGIQSQMKKVVAVVVEADVLIEVVRCSVLFAVMK